MCHDYASKKFAFSVCHNLQIIIVALFIRNSAIQPELPQPTTAHRYCLFQHQIANHLFHRETGNFTLYTTSTFFYFLFGHVKKVFCVHVHQFWFLQSKFFAFFATKKDTSRNTTKEHFLYLDKIHNDYAN